jgi:heat shock protein HtpX
MLGAYGLYTHVRSNRIKTGIVLVLFPFLLPILVFLAVIVIGLVGGNPSDKVVMAAAAYTVAVGFVIVPLMLLWVPIGYAMSQWIINRATSSQGVTRTEEPRLWNLLENLCISRGIKMPALQIIEAQECNAFASGVSENSYAVTVTRGLLDCLDDGELECVLAHELTHIRNRDVHLLIVTTIIAGVAPLGCDLIVLLLRGILWLAFSPMRIFKNFDGLTYAIGMLAYKFERAIVLVAGMAFRVVSEFISLILSLFVSRKREFMADAGAVELTKNPEALISALRKVSGSSDVPTTVAAVRHMYFDNPRMMGMGGLLSTHPPIEKRIEAIVRYAQQYGPLGVPPRNDVATEEAKVKALPRSKDAGRRFDLDYHHFLRSHLQQLGTTDGAGRNAYYKRVSEILAKQLELTQPRLSDEEWVAEDAAFKNAVRQIEKDAVSSARPANQRVVAETGYPAARKPSSQLKVRRSDRLP